MFPEVDPAAWSLACEGELGNQSFWEPEYAALGEVRDILNSLEGSEKGINWKQFLGGHRYFDVLKDGDFPPLYNENSYEQLFAGDFLFISPSDDDDDQDDDDAGPGMSFVPFRLYVDTDRKAAVIQEFTSFLAHLQTLPIVRRIMGYDQVTKDGSSKPVKREQLRSESWAKKKPKRRPATPRKPSTSRSTSMTRKVQKHDPDPWPPTAFSEVFKPGKDDSGNCWRVRDSIDYDGWGDGGVNVDAILKACAQLEITVKKYVSESPANPTCYHLDAVFLDGKLISENGRYFGCSRGMRVHGARAVLLLALQMGLAVRQAWYVKHGLVGESLVSLKNRLFGLPTGLTMSDDSGVNSLVKYLGRMPTLIEWLKSNYLFGLELPLDAEVLSSIPRELRSQLASLPPEYGITPADIFEEEEEE